MRAIMGAQIRALAVQIDSLQTVFMLFFAIFWVLSQTCSPGGELSTGLWSLSSGKLNAVRSWDIRTRWPPDPLFVYGMWALQGRGPTDSAPLAGGLHYAIRGILPAFAVFGLYRLWLALIELYPDFFYALRLTR